jgi:hypothetical protein
MPRKRLWEEREERIRTAAYFRAERRTFQMGREREDWLAAEAEIDATWRPSQDFWMEGVEELFESVVSYPPLAQAFSPILSTLPQPMLLEFAKKSLVMKDYEAKTWRMLAPYLTDESVAGLLSENRDPEAATLVVSSRPEMWQQGIDLILSSSGSVRDPQRDWDRRTRLLKVAEKLGTGELPDFWRRLSGCSTWEKGEVLRAVIGRLPRALFAEARSIAREVEDFHVRIAILKQIALRSSDAWPELLDCFFTTSVDRDRLNYLRWNVNDLPAELLATAANAARAEQNRGHRAELLEVLAERAPALWREALEARYQDLCDRRLGDMSEQQWSAASIEEKSLYVTTALRNADRALLLGRLAAAYPQLWPTALDAVEAASEAGDYWNFNAVSEFVLEKAPPDLTPQTLRILLNRDRGVALEDEQTITSLLKRTPEARLPEILEAARARTCNEAVVVVLEWMATQKDEELSLDAMSAALKLPDYSVRQRVLSTLFDHPRPVFLHAALQVARTLPLEANRADLLTLIAPHLSEIWSEALAALESVVGHLRFQYLDRSLKHLPQPLFPHALRLATGVDNLSRRAQLLGQIVAYGPPGLLPDVLREVEQLPHYPKASALAKLAFHVPSQCFRQLDRLAPWFPYGYYARLLTVMDKLKAYQTILPARLIRNLRVCLFNLLYQGWVSVEGRNSELFGSALIDPGGPAPSYWPFQTPQWDLAMECSAYTKPKLEKGSWFVLSLWIYQPSQREQARELAKELGRDTPAARSTGHRAAKGSRITLSFTPRHLLIQDGSPQVVFERSFLWQGEPANIDVLVQCPPTYQGDEVFETINILVEGLKVGEAVIDITFAPNKAQSSKTAYRPVESAFASYSHLDTAEVIARLQVVEKLVPGIRLFWDVESLHSGDKWQERLAEEVLNKDVFYLFWSRNAAQSEWVNWEWHCAYDKKGIDYIDPLPLDQTQPPSELESLQFADRWVRHLKYEELLRRYSNA